MIATTAYYCYVENSHNTDVALYSYTNLKERGEGCRCYMIATTAYYCYIENSHDADATLHPSLQRARRRLQMLYDCDDGVLLVRRGAVMTQMLPYTRSSKRARYEYAKPRPKYDSPHQPSASAPARIHRR